MSGSSRGLPGSSSATRTRKLARVFMNGRSQAVRLPRSQAVRLPKEFRFDTDRVGIRREGCNVILSPVYEDWDDYFENAPPIGDDFVRAMSGARRNLMPLEDREALD